jgi:bis(5'-nucleosidyl)-tetraphosphatase
MTLDAIRDQLPDYARDLKLNLGSVLTPQGAPGLSEPQIASIALATAIAARNPQLVRAIEAWAQPSLDAAHMQAARSAAAIMGMNNIYYRFLHLVEDAEYQTRHRQAGVRAVVAGGLGRQRLRSVRDLTRAQAPRRRHRSRSNPECGTHCFGDARGRGRAGVPGSGIATIRGMPPPRTTRLSAGVVVVRTTAQGWRFLLLRAFNHWDFPKGMVEVGEEPLAAAIREVREETLINDLQFSWGETYTETGPYSRGKVARYYLARTETSAVTLTVIEALGRAEHNEFRWVDYEGATRLVSPRVQPIVDWAWQQIET